MISRCSKREKSKDKQNKPITVKLIPVLKLRLRQLITDQREQMLILQISVIKSITRFKLKSHML